MTVSKHEFPGDFTGKVNQPQGRHRFGRLVIPLGTRYTKCMELNKEADVLEERDCVDIATSRRR